MLWYIPNRFHLEAGTITFSALNFSLLLQSVGNPSPPFVVVVLVLFGTAQMQSTLSICGSRSRERTSPLDTVPVGEIKNQSLYSWCLDVGVLSVECWVMSFVELSVVECWVLSVERWKKCCCSVKCVVECWMLSVSVGCMSVEWWVLIVECCWCWLSAVLVVLVECWVLSECWVLLSVEC